jgi:hypothetical protein
MITVAIGGPCLKYGRIVIVGDEGAPKISAGDVVR